MKLLTSAIIKRFAKVGSQQEVSDPIIIAKFFDPTGSWTWYATEWNPAEGNFYGLVHGFEKEWGYFNLKELEAVRGKFGLGIERDRGFGEKKVSEIK